MKSFRSVLREMNMQLNSVLILESLIESVMVFLAAFLALMLLSLPGMYGMIPAAIYLIIMLYIRVSEDKGWRVEQEWDALSEKLRTAEDTAEVIDNPVVDTLRNEVADDLKDVKVSTFISMRSTSLKAICSVALCFFILFVTLSGFVLVDFEAAIRGIPRFELALGDGEGGSGDAASAGIAGGELKFGEESVAALGSEEVIVEINAGGFEITGVRSQEDIPKGDFEESFPDEYGLHACEKPPCILENDVPLEQQELVKNYFLRLSTS
ncbi:TPA: hypothetical protein HA361_01715 [Candidatus Woesearchaeota archaeon]|nr:hypothetical protein [Candidatus Woesearchaeota archaeon]HII68848.1 hypothetical protein [Candidatus Woesearchaeota archaeon]